MQENNDRIERLENQILIMQKRNTISYALLSTAIYLFFYIVVNTLFAMLFDKVSFAEHLQHFDWIKLIFMAGLWLVIHFLWLVKDNKKRLKKKEEELEQLKSAF